MTPWTVGIKDLSSPSFLSFLPSFIPDVLCDPTDIIWRNGTPFEAMTGRTTPSSDGLLAEVSRGFPQMWGKCQEICVQSQDQFIITLIFSDRRDTRGKWPLARNPDRCWWHHHISFKFLGRSPFSHGQQICWILGAGLIRLWIRIIGEFFEWGIESLVHINSGVN